MFARDFSKTGKLELSGSPRWITTETRPHVMQELALRDKIIQEKNAQLATLTANLHVMRALRPFCVLGFCEEASYHWWCVVDVTCTSTLRLGVRLSVT